MVAKRFPVVRLQKAESDLVRQGFYDRPSHAQMQPVAFLAGYGVFLHHQMHNTRRQRAPRTSVPIAFAILWKVLGRFVGCDDKFPVLMSLSPPILTNRRGCLISLLWKISIDGYAPFSLVVW